MTLCAAQLMESAVLHHRAGHMDEAEALYRRVLDQSPDDCFALHSLGLLEYQRGRLIQASTALRKAIEINDRIPHFHNTLGVILEALGQVDQAIDCYHKAVALNPAYAEAYNNMAIALQSQGRYGEAVLTCRLLLGRVPQYAKALHTLGFCQQALGRTAEAEISLRKALDLDHGLFEAHNHLGVTLAAQGRYPEALECYRKALECMPEYAEAHNNMAVTLRALGRIDEAISHYQTALLEAPGFAEAYYNLANAQVEKGQYDLAEQNCTKALEIRPHYAQPYNQLGILATRRGDLDQAVEYCQKAIERDPKVAEFYNNLAIALRHLEDYSRAVAYYMRAIELDGRFPEPYYNLGNLYKDLGDCTQAIQYYDQAIARKPDYAEAHWNRSITLLLNGDLEAGWAQYAWRTRANLDTTLHPHSYTQPTWNGSDLSAAAGKRVLIYCEQGLGDAIQFVRYVPLVKPRMREASAGPDPIIILETWPHLKGLFAQVQGVDRRIETSTEKVPEDQFDLRASIMDLPAIFGTSLDTIPGAVPYLSPDAERVQAWRHRLDCPDLKVGIVWAGRPTHGNDRKRSCPLDYFVPLTQVQGLRFFSLQKGPGADQLRNGPPDLQIYDLADDLTDLMDAACCVAALDLVISVDTALAHLAGALAKPVWTLLAFSPDWRWMLNRQDSPWYPTMRLFRQQRPGDWGSVFAQVLRQLKTLSPTNEKPCSQ